ncbi:M23 family metallopeptidase [Nonomuraea sp. SBT364]|uniref:M23 family metallopeptidase n=1 Tax=Nonomuraea sp. SBT364 TaxID=1580530 RepID=UPI000A6A1EFB|nr:M23 family metallopeptidase [Nonomuraea sp. SBT364]
MSPFTFLRVGITAALIAAAGVFGMAGPAMAAAPDLQLPFPCGQKWQLNTWAHAPALDMVKEPDQHGTDGATLVAPAAGTVDKVFYHDNGGNVLQINHGGGYFTTYIHLKSRASVSPGDRVQRGTVIGKVGATGKESNGHPHLHFELAYDANGDGDASWGYSGSERIRPVFNGVTYGQSNGREWNNVESRNCSAPSPEGRVSVYGVLAGGQLTYTALDGASGRRTHGAVVSEATLGFTPKAMATLNFNTILVTEEGREGRLYRVDVRTNDEELIFEPPVFLGTGYTHDLLAFDGSGHLFGIAGGVLRRYTIGAAKPVIGDISGNVAIDEGFALKTLTATGPDWIAGTAADGRLLSYRIRGAGSWQGYELRGSTWQVFDHLLSPGGGVLYGHRPEGSLFRYFDQDPYDGRGDDLTGQGAVDETGWTQTLLSAQPGTVSSS